LTELHLDAAQKYCHECFVGEEMDGEVILYYYYYYLTEAILSDKTLWRK
jgi:hypothetical protein